MAQRINISVSDELHEQLQEFKDSINVSKLCQKIIAEEIKKKTDFQKRIIEAPEMPEVIERLRKEKGETFGGIKELGRKDGIEWAKAAHYLDLMDEAKYYEPNPEMGPISPTCYNYAEQKYGDNIISYAQEAFPELYVTQYSVGYIEIYYGEGWHDAVREFWKEIEKLI